MKRLYINNFRCLENFSLEFGDHSSLLLLGRNGAGKTTMGLALGVLQSIARGTSRVGDLLMPEDITRGRVGVPARFEIEVLLGGKNYAYSVAFEFPTGFWELRVFEEKLLVDGISIFTRELAQVRLARTGAGIEAAFRIDWHVVALPIIQEQNSDDPLSVFKKWLASILILKPVPSLAQGESRQNAPDLRVPDIRASNLGSWFSAMNADRPATYAEVKEYLVNVMPDFVDVTNHQVAKETRSLRFHFQKEQRSVELALEELSDGETCFFIFALAISANTSSSPILCFWDEPDNFLAPDEVGLSVMALRKAYHIRGQLIVTSHNPEAIRRFSDENTLLLSRRSHLEPTTIRSIEKLRESKQFQGDFIDALIRGDVGE